MSTNRYDALAGVIPSAGQVQVDWQPVSEPQTLAYDTPAFETLYGGEAGSGKSGLLLGLALTAHKRSKIFRRESTQLNGLLSDIERFLDPFMMQANPPHYSGRKLRWDNIPGGRSITFGSMKEVDDWKKHKGDGFDLFGFDELTEFEEMQYRQVIAWVRSIDKYQRTRVVATTNPNTDESGEWVLHRWLPWLDPDLPEEDRVPSGKILYFAQVGEQEEQCDGPDPIVRTVDGEEKTITPISRTYIHGRTEDNIYLEADYKARMMASLPPEISAALFEGKWSKTRSGRLRQIIPAEWVEAAQERWTSDCKIPVTRVGVDVSRGGKDDTVIARRRLYHIDPVTRYPGKVAIDGDIVAAWANAACDSPGTPITVDADGVGGSAFDVLKKSTHPTLAFKSAEKCELWDMSGLFAFINMRAWLWWNVRELLDPKRGLPIALPPDKDLKKELTSPCYLTTPRGIKVESKDEVRRRLRRSTDAADAVLMALLDVRAGQGFTAMDIDW